MKTRILVYHGIFKDPNEIFYSSREWVDAVTFDDHCKVLVDEGYNSISMNEFYSKKESNNLSEKDIVITFDDAAICQIKHALPLLKKYKLKATFYIPVLWLNKTKRFSDNDLKLLSDEGMEIGSHSMSHPDFRFIKASDTQEELKMSKEYLENVISKPVTHFSYPFGRGNNNINSILSDEGYKTAVTVDRGINKTNTDNYGLYRIGIYGFTDSNLLKKHLRQRFFVKYYFMRYSGDTVEKIIGNKRKENFFRFIHNQLESKRFR